MTREEEIMKAARVYANGIAQHLPNEKYCEEDFIAGAEWADAHPHWISVDDELPKLNSGMVIVATYKGDIDFMIFSNSGWRNSKRWCCVKGVITHWMPLPKMPVLSKSGNTGKKGGDQ